MCSVTEAAGTSIFFLLHLLVLLEAGVEAVGLCVCVGLSRLLDWQRFISDPDGVQPLAARSAGGCVRIRLHLHASSCLSRHFPGRYDQPLQPTSTHRTPQLNLHQFKFYIFFLLACAKRMYALGSCFREIFSRIFLAVALEHSKYGRIVLMVIASFVPSIHRITHLCALF